MKSFTITSKNSEIIFFKNKNETSLFLLIVLESSKILSDKVVATIFRKLAKIKRSIQRSCTSYFCDSSPK